MVFDPLQVPKLQKGQQLFSEMSRPRIACFHGGGSSSSIYAVQCATLQKHLQQDFEFVFFEAPFTRDAGPGVLPWFSYEEYGPYRTWFSKTAAGEELGDGRADMSNGEGGVERVLRMIESYDEDERVRVIEQYDGKKGPLDVGKGEWVGLMGFSQGTRVVGGLLLHQQRRRELGLGNPGIEFKFGVLCMGSGAPMVSDLSDGKFVAAI